MKSQRSASVVLIVAVVCVSSGSILIRMADAPALTVALYRLGYAAIIHALLSVPGRRDYLRFDRGTLLKSLAAGAALSVHFVLWILSLDHTTVAASTVLMSFHPVFTAVFAYVALGETLSRGQMVSVVLALIGTIVIAGGAHFAGGSLLGDGLALAGGAALAVYLLVGRQVRERISTLTYTTVVYSFAAVCVMVLMVILGRPLGGGGPREHLIFVALAVVPTLLGHTLLNWSLAHIQAFDVSASALGEPVGATLLAYFLLHEVPAPHQLAGGAMVLVALGLLLRNRNAAGRLRLSGR